MAKENIYTISPTVPFLDSLADGILERYSADNLEFSKILILLPNRRSCRALQESFGKLTGGKPLLLPSIRPIGDADEDEMFMSSLSEEMTQPISPLRRKLLLTKLILDWQHAKEVNKYNQEQAVFLAGELANFINEMQKEEIGFGELHKIVPLEFAEHWQITLDFFSLLSEEWPKILRKEDKVDPFEYKKFLIKKQIEKWKKSPPDYPVIVAGSTGSIRITSELIKAVSMQEKGMVIVPALDNICDDKYWNEIKENHPQFGIKSLLANLEVGRGDIGEWNMKYSASKEREMLASELFRPSELIQEWLSKNIKEEVIKNISFVETEDYQQESKLIALCLREAVEENKTAALITNNRNIARAVSSVMKKWDINIDDSRGVPLSETSQAVYLRLVSKMISENFAPLSLLSVFKNPYAAGGLPLNEFRKRTRRIEKEILRGVRLYKNINDLEKELNKAGEKELSGFIAKIRTDSEKINSIYKNGKVKFSEILKVHMEFCEELASTDKESGMERLWSGEEARKLAGFISQMILDAEDFGEIDSHLYPAIFESLLKGEVYRPGYGFYKRLSILSPIEARLLYFDVAIVAGLNEENWPRKQINPWMSNNMREQMGFESMDRTIGLSSHDFYSFLCQPKIVISRAKKLNGSLTIPSRWLMRLGTLLSSNSVCLEQNRYLAEWSNLLSKPPSVVPAPVSCPSPALEVRQGKISVTQVEKLLRNPYLIYTDKILGLKYLEEIDIDPGAADFGNIIHNALEYFILNYKSGDKDEFIAAGKQAFGDYMAIEGVKNIWWPRYEALADKFVTFERKRRTNLLEVIVEDKGKYEFTYGNDNRFELSGRADRIEITLNNEINIIDYKTGTTPKTEDIESGLSPQLALEGLILLEGNFKKLGERIQLKPQVVNLQYIKLSGNKKITPKIYNNPSLIEQARTGLFKVLNHFFAKRNPYYSNPYHDDKKEYKNYNHLSRFYEWTEGI